MTAGDFFYLRYGKIGWVIFLIITITYSTSWLVSMAIAGGDLLESLAGIPYVQGMSIILAVCVGYTLFGGMYAVIGTDFIQSILILLGILVIGYLVWGQLDMQDTHAYLSEYQPSLLLWVMPAALLAVFNNLLFGFGRGLSQQCLVVQGLCHSQGVCPESVYPRWFSLVSHTYCRGFHCPGCWAPWNQHSSGKSNRAHGSRSSAWLNRAGYVGRGAYSDRSLLFDGILDRLLARGHFGSSV